MDAARERGYQTHWPRVSPVNWTVGKGQVKATRTKSWFRENDDEKNMEVVCSEEG